MRLGRIRVRWAGTRTLYRGAETLVLSLALSGCEGAERDEAPPHPGALPPLEWRFAEAMRIGAADGGDQNLTRVNGFLPLPDGSVWIVQGDDHQVRVYSAAGAFVRTVGQLGQAPGEFVLPNAIGWWGTSRDTIWVRDNQRRITLFTPDGEYARSFSWVTAEYLERWRAGRPDALLPDGSALGIGNSPPEEELVDLPLLRFDPVTGAAPRELARLRRVEAVRQTASTTLRLPIPYHELVAYSPDGSWFTVVDRAAFGQPAVGTLPVHAISAEGDTVWSRTFTYRPGPIPRPLIDSILDARTESRMELAAPRGDTRAEARAWVEAKYTFPGHYPPIETALIGVDGRLWLEWRGEGEAPGDWWVLSPDGDPLARITPDRRISPLAADEGGVWALELDALDVPYVVRYRIGTGEGARE